jgi:hypothetical protein
VTETGTELRVAVAAFAARPRVLVAADFDRTLTPFVPNACKPAVPGGLAGWGCRRRRHRGYRVKVRSRVACGKMGSNPTNSAQPLCLRSAAQPESVNPHRQRLPGGSFSAVVNSPVPRVHGGLKEGSLGASRPASQEEGCCTTFVHGSGDARQFVNADRKRTASSVGRRTHHNLWSLHRGPRPQPDGVRILGRGPA